MNTDDTRPPPPNAAEQLRGFGPLGLLAIVVILAGALVGPPVSASLVLAWAWLSRTPWPELGLRRPRSWARTAVVGVVFGSAFKLALKALVMPLLGAPPANPTYHYLAGNTAALPGILAAVVIGAGIGEELFFRAYLFERSARLFGRSRTALTATVVLSAAVFALAHFQDQGLPGVEQAAVTGLVFGGTFAWRRELPIVMIAHAAFDVTAVALIYWNWEVPLARLLFR